MHPAAKKLTAILSISMLSSCVLGPNLESPSNNAPNSIRGAYASKDSFGDLAWAQVFSEPHLKALIDKAIANNPDLIAASYRVEEARAMANAAKADWFPQLNGGVGGTANYATVNQAIVPPNFDRDSESYNMSGQLSWELDLWGKIRRSNQSARAKMLQAAYQRDAIRISLISSVATAYIELKNLDERLAIAKRTAESRKVSLDLVTSRRNGGVSSDLEVNQAQALLDQARTSIPTTEKAIFAKENQIRALLGEYPSSVARSGSLKSLESNIHIKSGIPSNLLQRRPDLAAADQDFQAATADIGVAQAMRLPSLRLTGSGGFVSDNLSELLEGHSGTYSIGPNLTGPIFDAGRNRSRVEAAKARAKQAQAAYDKAAQQAFRETSDSINAYVKNGEIAKQQANYVSSLSNVANIAMDRFQGGASSYLEVLDAQRSLFLAELDLADARQNRLLAVVATYRALGGGWK